jgi:flavin-dependent dehydrogenase
MNLIQVRKPPAREVDLQTVYDAVVVGSGAAGGMAAHVLTSRGLIVTPPQRVAVLTRMSAHESDPKTPGELFFRELKERTIYAYYTSKIGIHDEMEYKGNTLLTEFVGAELSM